MSNLFHMTFQGLVIDYFPKSALYIEGLEFVEGRMNEISDEMFNDERLNWPTHRFGALYKFCEDRSNGEEWVRLFKRRSPRDYTICCIVLSLFTEAISPEDEANFSLSSIPIFFDENVEWSDNVRKVLKKRVNNPSIIAETCYNLLLKEKNVCYQHSNYDNFESTFKKGLEKLIIRTFTVPEEEIVKKHAHVFRKYSAKGYALSNLQWIMHGKVGYVVNSKAETLVGTSPSYRIPLSSPTRDGMDKFARIVAKYNIFRQESEEESF